MLPASLIWVVLARMVSSFHNTVFNYRIVPDINVIQNDGIFNDTVISDICLL